MTLYNVMKAIHVIAAIVFIGGVFARQIVRGYAKTTDDVVWFATLMRAAGRVENRMVRPGSILVFVLGVIQAYLGGIPMLGVLQGASQNWLLVSNLLFVSGFALVPLVFLPRSRIYRPVLEAALAEGRFTPALREVMNDPVVKIAHLYEEAMLVAIVVLMVLKPF